MDQNIKDFIFSAYRELFDFMAPNLFNYKDFSQSLSKQVQVKEDENIQYSFDVELDKLIKNKLEEFSITGKVFSEESGWFESGDKKYRVVYDPFCNSSLASRTFHEAAVGISIFSYDYELITSAIMDYQTGIVALVEDGSTKFYQIQSKEEILFSFSKNESLDSSWVMITLENKEERKYMSKAARILSEAKRVLISSGHIYWLKLASGAIDAYLDPFGGEKLYEMFACAVAQKSGCIVTDLSGKDFDPGENLKIFESDKNFIYYPVAASNRQLHKEILDSLNS